MNLQSGHPIERQHRGAKQGETEAPRRRRFLALLRGGHVASYCIECLYMEMECGNVYQKEV